MIHSSYYKPNIIPILGTGNVAEIDRAQSIDPTVSLNRDKIEEIGRDGAVGYLKKTPSVSYRLTQLEYGSIEFWQKIVNTEVLGNVGENAITLNDFKTPYFDILAYLTDDDSTFRGTVYYPALRTNGFSVSIGDPQGMIERSFDFIGESAQIWQGTNKYVIYGTKTVGSGDDNEIDLTAKAPVVDPDNAGVYMLRVVRVTSAGVSTVLATTEYSYSNSTKILTVTTVATGDVIKYWFTSATAPATQFALNDVDVAGLLGDSASIYLYIPSSGKPSSSDYIYRLQSVTLDVKLDREDLREIGNKNVVQRGIKNSTVTVTFNRILEQFTIEEVLRGEVAGFGKIDVEKFSDDITLIVKIFSDNTKSTLKYGFLATGLTATSTKAGASVNEYTKAETVLEGENLSITCDATVLGI